MATTVLKIYQDVCNTLLENSGLATLGIMTDTDFYNYLRSTIREFLQLTGITKKLFNVPAHAFTASYTEPDNAMDVQVVNYDRTYTYRSSGWYLDHFNPSWTVATSIPERWREDETPPKTLQIEPMPQVEGYQVGTTVQSTGFSVIAATSNAVDFNIVLESGSGYGTISGGFGLVPASTNTIYLECINAGYGVPASIVSSTANIQMVATTLPTSYPQTYFDYIQLIPDSFIPALKYGILTKIFTGDTEYKDLQRGKYCQARYQEITSAAAAIMMEEVSEE